MQAGRLMSRGFNLNAAKLAGDLYISRVMTFVNMQSASFSLARSRNNIQEENNTLSKVVMCFGLHGCHDYLRIYS